MSTEVISQAEIETELINAICEGKTLERRKALNVALQIVKEHFK